MESYLGVNVTSKHQSMGPLHSLLQTDALVTQEATHRCIDQQLACQFGWRGSHGFGFRCIALQATYQAVAGVGPVLSAVLCRVADTDV